MDRHLLDLLKSDYFSLLIHNKLKNLFIIPSETGYPVIENNYMKKDLFLFLVRTANGNNIKVSSLSYNKNEKNQSIRVQLNTFPIPQRNTFFS